MDTNDYYNIALINSSGREIYIDKWSSFMVNEVKVIDISSLPKGIYLLRITNNKVTAIKTVIVH